MRHKPNKLEEKAKDPTDYEIVELPDPDIDYDSGKPIRRIPASGPSSRMPAGVRGYFDGEIVLPDNISAKEEIGVKAHESAHAMGIRSEKNADAYASAKTGQFLRFPIGDNYSLN